MVKKPSLRAIWSAAVQADTVDVPLTVSLEIPAHSGSLPRTGSGFELLIAFAILLVVTGALLKQAVR